MVNKKQRRAKIKTRIRGRVSGTAQRPRMTVFRSNKEIYVQLIDDRNSDVRPENGSVTLVSASSRGLEGQGTKVEIAAKVGEAIAQKALQAGITEVVFDRNGYLFHGRVKSLADAARKGGLKF
ncbi:MAG: 50S ribosomal protein L18 [Bacteroidales bacterium]|nr:50S ribosomal protein L18 [Bacteroidales bacterium]MCD8386148.1 50S ribosomal protein L18 [Bacteroidales bacterium]